MINTTESNLETNTAQICGEVAGELKFSHRTYGEAFYTMEVGVMRNSGYEDRIVVMTSERIISSLLLAIGTRVVINGQVRTYNEDIEGHNKLNIVIFAKDISYAGEDKEACNEIHLEGYICKKPMQRTSPLGRKICDLMLAVNRMHNKSDYIPCIAWGRNAVYSGTLAVGDKIILTGRLQSRQYKKKSAEGDVMVKTAYEVSILQLETAESDVI